MRFLFKPNDSIEVNIRPVIVNDEDSEYTTTGIYFRSEGILRIKGMLRQWQKMKRKYEDNEITKEALEDWKAIYPDNLKKVMFLLRKVISNALITECQPKSHQK